MLLPKQHIRRELGVSEVKLALILFILSLAGIGTCIPALQQATHSQLVFDLPLHLGQSSTFVIVDQECIAEFSQTLMETEPMKLVLNGKLLGEEHFGSSLSLEAHFNDLGQLLNSTFELKDNDSSFEMKTKSVHPISLTTLTYDRQRALTDALTLSGPISLKKIQREKFLLDLTHVASSSDSKLRQWLALTENKLSSTTIVLSQDEQACHAQKQNSQTPSFETLLRAFLHSENGAQRWTTKL